MSPEPPLWAPWRLQYILSDKSSDSCVFCFDQASGISSRDALILHERDVTNVVLNKFPYNSAHLLIVPKRHVGTLQELTPEESCELMALTTDSVRVLTESYKPAGFNVGINLGRSAGAGITAHLHQHIVPRWEGDNNFMPVISETHVMPEHLLATYDKLKPLFDKLT